MRTDEARDALILAHTDIVAPPLVPEIRLHLAKEVTAVWDATEEALEESLPPPFWGFCWPGGQVVARYLLDHPELVRGQNVLDFASGSGVAAIAAVRAGAARVIATEIDEFAIAAMHLNAALNDVVFDISLRDVVDAEERWNVVIAGDVCYDREMSERVVRWLRRLAARGATVLMADPGRPYSPKQGLEELARYDVPAIRELEELDSKETRLYRLLP